MEHEYKPCRLDHACVHDVFDDLQEIIKAATSHAVRQRCDQDDLHYLNGFLRWARTTGHDVPPCSWDSYDHGDED